MKAILNIKPVNTLLFSFLLIPFFVVPQTLSAQQEQPKEISVDEYYSTASHLQTIYENNTRKEHLYESAEYLYLKILQQDSLHRLANYGLGSLYNNKAVYEKGQMNKGIKDGSVKPENIQDEIKAYEKLFEKSELHMKRFKESMKGGK